MNVFVVGQDYQVVQMFENAKHTVVEYATDDHDLVVFTGGADVNPVLYGERPLPGVQISPARDRQDVQAWKFTDPKKPKVGICRGSQFGNVMCGGRLWQDVDGHANGKGHMVKDLGKKNGYLPVSSTHHQMSRLAKGARLLAVAKEARMYDAEGDQVTFDQYDLGRITDKMNQWYDVEAFYYENFNFLGVQFHPEYKGWGACQEFFWKLIDEYSSGKDLPTLQEGQRII